jgi:hypothetical protein
MYANGNAANVNGLDTFVMEDDVSREKGGDIVRHTHVLAWFGIHNPVRLVFGPRYDLCHKGLIAGGVRAFGDGEMMGNKCGAVKTNSAI